jgi:hypothetical protein
MPSTKDILYRQSRCWNFQYRAQVLCKSRPLAVERHWMIKRCVQTQGSGQLRTLHPAIKRHYRETITWLEGDTSLLDMKRTIAIALVVSMSTKDLLRTLDLYRQSANDPRI